MTITFISDEKQQACNIIPDKQQILDSMRCQ